MKVVIDITESQYTTLNAKTQDDIVDVIDHGDLIKAIKNGTPLPKGHGRLIDADVAKEIMLDEMCGTGYQSRAMYVLESMFTPTIIEADKEMVR